MDGQSRRLYGRLWAAWAGLTTSLPAWAHAVAGSGLLHPLTGADHAVAMMAVGAWSAQMGGRAIWTVPSAFVLFMAVGGLLGFNLIDLPGVEVGIAASVLLLGLAIALRQRLPVLLAALAVAVFGVFHGYAHGYEMPVMADKWGYAGGFLFSTAMLHVAGAVGAHQLIRRPWGAGLLRALGWAAAAFGFWLLGGHLDVLVAWA